MGACLRSEPTSKANVPKESLQFKYKSAIDVITNWWMKNIENLSDDKYLEIAIDFCNNILIIISSSKGMFTSRNVDYNSQALKMLGMFRWIVLTLNSSLNSNILIGLHQLGALHDSLGITFDDYEKTGDIFHATMTKFFADTYNLRVKWCFTVLYEIIVGVMMGQDFCKVCNKQKDHLISLWKQINIVDQNNSFEECFNNVEVMSYLKLFMKEKFCIELLLFIIDYQKYKLLFTDIHDQDNNYKQQIEQNIINNPQNTFGEYMKELYMEINSKQQVNISGTCRNLFYRNLETQNNMYTLNIYDECYDEVIQLLEISVYPNFKQAIKECINSVNAEASATKTIDFVYVTNRSLHINELLNM